MDNKLESYITKLLLFCYLIKNLSNYIFDNKYIKSYIYLEGKKRNGSPWKMATAIFSFVCKTFKSQGQRLSKTPHQPTQDDGRQPRNIRESILDFTSHFGEINPDMPYLCRRGLSGPQRVVFAFFPSVSRESMKKNVKSSIFRKKTSKILSSLPFKT